MIIGLVGYKQVGKDTVARMLGQHGFTHQKFAGGLKYMLRSLLRYQGLDEEYIDRLLEGDLKERPCEYLAGESPRWAMESLGTEWGRVNIGRDFWIAVEFQASRQNPHTVFSDVRHLNEAAAVKAVGGQLWRITRPGHERTTNHSSELIIEKITCDFTLENSGTIGDLTESVADLVVKKL